MQRRTTAIEVTLPIDQSLGDCLCRLSCQTIFSRASRVLLHHHHHFIFKRLFWLKSSSEFVFLPAEVCTVDQWSIVLCLLHSSSAHSFQLFFRFVYFCCLEKEETISDPLFICLI